MPVERSRKLLAFNMKRLREVRGISADELAERAELSGGYIRQVETFRKWVSPATLDAIAKALRAPIHELFKDSHRS